LISQISAPADTVWPTSTESPVTVPSLCAASGCSIFIASSTTTGSPVATRWPSATAILMIVPCIGLISVSPPVPAWCERRPRLPPRGVLARGAWEEGPSPQVPAGSTTSSRLPPTSTVIACRSAGSAACAVSWDGIGVANSVSIQRVYTPSGSPVNAGSVTTARWNGSTVGIPPTSNSASALAARSRACGRLAPVTISLAISESNT
jgi:hypothetical protein